MNKEKLLFNQIKKLKRKKDIFITHYDTDYKNDVQENLAKASRLSKKDYDETLDFESAFLLQIEKKHSCYSLFKFLVSKHKKTIEDQDRDDYFRIFLEKQEDDIRFKNKRFQALDEVLDSLREDLERNGWESSYIKKILPDDLL